MSESATVDPATADPTPKKAENLGGRPEILDELKKNKVLGLIELGHSRRTAGRLVGCSGITITRAATRDPDFAAKLDEAESHSNTEALKLIRQTANQERYWRAAAWVLERRIPEEYGRRAPKTFTSEEVQKMFSKFVQLVLAEVPYDRQDAVLDLLDETLADVDIKPNGGKFTISWNRLAELDDVADVMPPRDRKQSTPEVLYRLEAACPKSAEARADFIKSLSQDQIESLLLRAHQRMVTPDNKRWMNDLSRRLAEIIALRGGELVLKQFSQKGE
jgi:hypothetical protein